MAYKSTLLKRDFEISEIVTIHYFEYMKDFFFSGESHDFWELMYVDKGEMLVTAGTSQHLLRTGDVIFHQPNEFHALHSVGDKSPNLVNISFLCDSPAMEFFQQGLFHLSDKEQLIISQILLEAGDAFNSPLNIPQIEQVSIDPNAPFGSQQFILIYLETLLIQIHRNHSHEKKAAIPLASPENAERFSPFQREQDQSALEQILTYMDLHISERLTVQRICSDFSISPSTLYGLFYKNFNHGAIDHFLEMKIAAAKHMIRDGSMNFTEIAHYLSFGSLQYFSKRFKLSTGMSPMEYSTSVKNYSNSVSLSSNLARRRGPRRSYR